MLQLQCEAAINIDLCVFAALHTHWFNPPLTALCCFVRLKFMNRRGFFHYDELQVSMEICGVEMLILQIFIGVIYETLYSVSIRFYRLVPALCANTTTETMQSRKEEQMVIIQWSTVTISCALLSDYIQFIQSPMMAYTFVFTFLTDFGEICKKTRGKCFLSRSEMISQ